MNAEPELIYQLSARDIGQIHQLQSALRAEAGLEYKLDMLTLDDTRETGAHILLREGGLLTGYAALQYYDQSAPEMMAMLRDAGRDFEPCLRLAADLCARRGAARLLLICGREDAALTARIKGAGLQCAFTEYRMSLLCRDIAPLPAPGTALRRATPADAAFIALLDGGAFPGGATSGEPSSPGTWIAEDGGAPVGKLRIDEDGPLCAIYGFVIAPSLRARGYGRSVLRAALCQIAQSPCEKVYLEVDSGNLAALHLYKTAGFVQDAAFDYYERAPA